MSHDFSMFAWAPRALMMGCVLWLGACRQPLTPPGAGPQGASSRAASPQAASPAPEAVNAAAEPAPSAKQAPAPKTAANMPIGAQHITEANTVYAQRCALCHGTKGQGDGVAAVNLRPQPRSFAVAEWQDATSDEAIMEIIVKGGAAVGRSMMMPPARDLAGQTELLRALVAVVRNFGPGGAKAPP